jgi:hypothetical protein
MFPTDEQQTIWIKVADLTPCMLDKAEDGETDLEFIETNFDIMVSGFVESLKERGFVLTGKCYTIAGDVIACVVTYMSQEDMQTIISRQRLAALGKQ